MSKRIQICTPCYGGMATTAYMQSLLRLERFQVDGMRFDHSFLWNESLITRARNILVHHFLESNNTHLMFVDADIEFIAEQVPSMVAANKGVVCGVYPKKTIRWEAIPDIVKSGIPTEMLPVAASDYCLEPLDQNDQVCLGKPELIKVKRAGTGFMMIERRVFEELMPHVRTYKASGFSSGKQIEKDTQIHEFFTTAIDEDGYLQSEDYHFCDLWNKHGDGVNVAQWVHLKHIGTHSFGGY